MNVGVLRDRIGRRTTSTPSTGEQFKFVCVDSKRGKAGKELIPNELCLYQFSLVTFLAGLLLVPKGRKNARLQHFGLGRDPVFKRPSFYLAAFLVDLIGTKPNLSLQQLNHHLSTFVTSSQAIHF
jgi:hypothetical protein